MMRNFFFAVIIFVVYVFASACASGHDDIHSSVHPGKTDSSAPLQLDVNTELVRFKFDRLIEDVPSSLEIVNDLNAVHSVYTDGLVLDKKKFESAHTDGEKAFFMGAYTIDMAYLIDFGKGTEALGYVSSVKKLAEEMGIATYYNKAYYDRFSKNLHQKDSLMNLVNSAFVLTDQYCRSHKNLKASVLGFTGSWAEALHLACLHKTNAPGNADSLHTSNQQIVLSQCKYIKPLIAALQSFKEDESCKRIMPVLMEMQSVYEENEAKKNAGGLIFPFIKSKSQSLRNLMFEAN